MLVLDLALSERSGDHRLRQGGGAERQDPGVVERRPRPDAPGRPPPAGQVRVLELRERAGGREVRELDDNNGLFVSYTPLAPSYRRDPEIDLLVSTLSARECHILELVTAGYSNQRIAEACVLSVHRCRPTSRASC